MMTGVSYSDKYDVFLSYRRDGGEMTALVLHSRLVAKGYRVFLDMESLRSGQFNKRLLTVIEGCTDFIAVLSPNSLDRCKNDGDWVRAEIAHAFAHDKNIVPIMLKGFEWPAPGALPEDIGQLPMQNGLRHNDIEYLDAMIDRLCGMFLQSKPAAPQMAAAPVKAPTANNPSVTVGDTIPFGPYDWLVLDAQDDRALLITNDIAEYKPYHHEQIDMTWADCDLRAYLNKEFYEGKFSAEEKERIVTVNNRNPDTRHLCADGKTFRVSLGGRNTEDRVFLLSIPEAIKYFDMSYVSAKELFADTEEKYWLAVHPEKQPYSYDAALRTSWYLRSPGCLQYWLAFINNQGVVGYSIGMDREYGVRPAMWIKL